MLGEVLLSDRAMGRGLFEYSAIQKLVVDHVNSHANHTRILRALVALEIWCRLFIDNESSEMFPEFG